MKTLARSLPLRFGLVAVFLFACTVFLFACTSAPEPATTAPDLAGTWRAVLGSPGGELPFTLRILETPATEDSPATFTAVAINGEEEAPFSAVTVHGDRVHLEIDWYDSVIHARLSPEDGRLVGEWEKTVPEGVSRLPFSAVRGDGTRFVPTEAATATPLTSVDGSWRVAFTDQDGTEPAVGQLHQEEGDSRVTGTFLTPTGDYRFLEGEFRNGLLRLSCFDGAHAFLFVAEATPEGTLEGDFWSRDSYHATWTAQPLDPEQVRSSLPNPAHLAQLTNQEQRFDFQLPDLEGNVVSLQDERFDGKVVLVNIFGSWCPNCNDEAPVLARWYREYRDQGLEIVGLAFEVGGDPERDAVFVRRFAERHGVEYPLLLAGNSDKAAAANLLEDLDRVVAYPTTIYIDRDGKVRKIHSGYTGPGTGEHFEELVREQRELIEGLLGE